MHLLLTRIGWARSVRGVLQPPVRPMANDASKSPVRLVVLASSVELAQRLAAEIDPGAEPVCVATVPQALLALRDEPCDAVIVRHDPPRIDAVVLACALRGAGNETPVAILGVEGSVASEAGADVGAPTGAGWVQPLREAITKRAECREARFALVAEQQRLARERAALDLLSGEQGTLLAALREVAGPDVPRYPAADDCVPESPARETPAARAA